MSKKIARFKNVEGTGTAKFAVIQEKYPINKNQIGYDTQLQQANGLGHLCLECQIDNGETQALDSFDRMIGRVYRWLVEEYPDRIYQLNIFTFDKNSN